MLYFDESGNSGDNLLDGNQPTYLLLSHDFTEGETKQILEPLMRVSKAHELHFKAIKKYSSQRKALIDCFSNKLIQPERIFFYVGHKQFMIVIHMIDKLAETLLYHHGIDIYQEGLNLSTANIMYIMGNNVWDKALFQAMCTRFVKWVRNPDMANRTAFYDAARDLAKSLKDKQDMDLLGLVLFSEPYAEEIEESFDT